MSCNVRLSVLIQSQWLSLPAPRATGKEIESYGPDEGCSPAWLESCLHYVARPLRQRWDFGGLQNGRKPSRHSRVCQLIVAGRSGRASGEDAGVCMSKAEASATPVHRQWRQTLVDDMKVCGCRLWAKIPSPTWTRIPQKLPVSRWTRRGRKVEIQDPYEPDSEAKRRVSDHRRQRQSL